MDPLIHDFFGPSQNHPRSSKLFNHFGGFPPSQRRFLRFAPQTRSGISLQVQGVSRAKLFHESKEEVRESDIFWVGMGMGDRIFLCLFFLLTLKSHFDF